MASLSHIRTQMLPCSGPLQVQEKVVDQCSSSVLSSAQQFVNLNK